MSGASGFVVSCGVRLSEVGFAEFRKPQVARSIRVAGSTFQLFTQPAIALPADFAEICDAELPQEDDHLPFLDHNPFLVAKPCVIDIMSR